MQKKKKRTEEASYITEASKLSEQEQEEKAERGTTKTIIKYDNTYVPITSNITQMNQKLQSEGKNYMLPTRDSLQT